MTARIPPRAAGRRPVSAKPCVVALEERMTPTVFLSENFDGVAAGTLPAG